MKKVKKFVKNSCLQQDGVDVPVSVAYEHFSTKHGDIITMRAFVKKVKKKFPLIAMGGKWRFKGMALRD